MTTAVDRVCQQCGHHFSTQAWKGKQGKGKFCSVAYHNAFQTGKPSLGYKCLIIWEHELKELEEEAVVAEVNNFFS